MTSAVEDLFRGSGSAATTTKEGFANLDVRQTIESMRRHQSHNGVQLDGIKHLITFASNEYNADLIVENDGLTAIVQALQAFSVDEKLVCIGLCLVGTLFLAASVEKLQQASTWKQTVSTLSLLLQAHASNQNVQSIGSFVLSAFVLHDCFVEYFLDCQCHSKIESMLNKFSNADEMLVENCATTIARLYSHQKFENDLRLEKMNAEFLRLLNLAVVKNDCDAVRVAINTLQKSEIYKQSTFVDNENDSSTAATAVANAAVAESLLQASHHHRQPIIIMDEVATKVALTSTKPPRSGGCCGGSGGGGGGGCCSSSKKETRRMLTIEQEDQAVAMNPTTTAVTMQQQQQPQIVALNDSELIDF